MCIRDRQLTGGVRGASSGTSSVRIASGRSVPSRAITPMAASGNIPAIDSYVASDPDNGDSVVSVGDILTVVFDAPCDWTGSVRGNRSFVDDIFRFAPELAVDYTGEWHNSSTFRIALLDTASTLTAVGSSTIALRQDGVDTDGDGIVADVHSVGSRLMATENEKLLSLQRHVQLTGSIGDANAIGGVVDAHVP
eukprot:6458823-Prymnesium_polylepis.1